jgi:hypothetical protein
VFSSWNSSFKSSARFNFLYIFFRDGLCLGHRIHSLQLQTQVNMASVFFDDFLTLTLWCITKQPNTPYSILSISLIIHQTEFPDIWIALATLFYVDFRLIEDALLTSLFMKLHTLPTNLRNWESFLVGAFWKELQVWKLGSINDWARQPVHTECHTKCLPHFRLVTGLFWVKNVISTWI